MRIFLASLATETNMFVPFPTAMSAFEEMGVARDASTSGKSIYSPASALIRTRAEAVGAELVESIAAFAQPSGVTVRAAYETLRDMVLDDLAAAGPVDIVLLGLHGAMVADGYDDCEGDIISRVRALCPNAVIGAELDPHCHLTDAMLRGADVLVIFKEYPHVDIADRAGEMFDICLRTARREIQPVAAMVDVRMVGIYPTFTPPMSDVVAGLRAIEARPGLLSASIAHGFPWADVTELGTRILVYADGDAAVAEAAAMEVAERMYALRDALAPNYPGIVESLDRAAGLPGLTVLGDGGDNAGGGAPSDSSFFLKALLDRNEQGAAIGCFHDPAVVKMAADAGVGARLAVRLGGKSGPFSGDPVDIDVEVIAVVPRHVQSGLGSRHAMGTAVALRAGGVDILVAERRSQVFDPDLFNNCGIPLSEKRLAVVKSSSHYEALFRPVADHLWHVKTPGALSLDFGSLPYTKRDPHFFPRVADPWAERPPEARIYRRGMN